MKINIPNGIGTLILSGCGQSNMIIRTQEDLDAGKSGRCGVDRICDCCMEYVFRNVSKSYKKEYNKSHSIKSTHNNIPQNKNTESSQPVGSSDKSNRDTYGITGSGDSCSVQDANNLEDKE